MSKPTKKNPNPKVRDLAPRKDAKGGNKTLGVACSSSNTGGKTSGISSGGGAPSI